MLGLSLGKLIVLAAIIAAVWFGFRWFERLQKLKDERRRKERVRNDPRGPDIVDLERNPKTGAYEPRRRND